MPEMGESVTEGIVLEWHVAEGDFVNEGDTVVEVSTDKVDAEVPAPTAGMITKLIAQVDDEVPVGAPLAEMEPGEAAADGEGSDGATAGPVAEGAPSPRRLRATRPPRRATRGRDGGHGRRNGSRCRGRRRSRAGWRRRTASTSAR